jgi:hypothetical protein
MSTMMSVICLVESKFNDSKKSGMEFGDAVFRMGPRTYEKFKWKVFYNTHNGPYSKQCQPFNENDIVHMLRKFTFIKIDDVETIAVSYLIYFECGFPLKKKNLSNYIIIIYTF